MPATPQSQAIQVVNALCACAQQLAVLANQIAALDAQWTDQGVATTLAAMGTVALNGDGTAGAADGSPNVAHPLNPATYPTLNRLISSNQVGSLKTTLDEVVTLYTGTQVNANAGARAIINGAVGG